MTSVLSEGRPDAKIVVVGESPGAQEERLGRPFVGDSGQRLMRWLKEVGLRRDNLYITNVVGRRPRNNDISEIPGDELLVWIQELRHRMDGLRPNVIVPLGNTALFALTGKTGIESHRGSIYEYKGKKVIGTLHPAAVSPYRNPALERRCILDWHRIAYDSTFPELRLPQREIYIQPSLADVTSFVAQARAEAEVLCFDIETVRETSNILCIGFSYGADFAFVIPTTAAYWGDTLPVVWEHIRDLCALPCAKLAQSCLFDTYHLARHGVPVTNMQWDTRAMHHCLDATDEHSLEYMASVDTRQPYWKDMHRNREVIEAMGSRERALWHYCGLDTAVTHELGVTYFERLDKRGKLEFYINHYQKMIGPLLRTMLHGIRVDEAARLALWEELKGQEAAQYEVLEVMAGESLLAKKTFSKLKMERFLYETLKLPKQKKTKGGVTKITADENAIRKLIYKYPEKFTGAGQAILGARRASKLATFAAEKLFDEDGYSRCQYNFTTATGRLSSSKNPAGTGGNHQNIDREIRRIYIPDPGHIFVGLDYSQLENKLVGCFTGDPELIEMALKKPWEWDEHRYCASVAFDVPENEVTKEPFGGQRYLGKRANHGSNYGMTGDRLSDLLFEEGIVMSPRECQRMIDRIMERFPGKRLWQEVTWQEVIKYRRLETDFGRELSFEWEPMNSSHTRNKALAFRPQSTGASMMNQFGYIPTDRWIQESGIDAHICAQVHDSLLVSAHPSQAWAVYQFAKETMEQPIDITSNVNGRVTSLVVPVGLTIGVRWGGEGTHEFRRPPTHDEFLAKVKELMYG